MIVRLSVLGQEPVVLRRLDARVNDRFALLGEPVEVEECPDHGHEQR
jgi:hypothetical protein